MSGTAERKDKDNYRWLSTLHSVAEQRYRERDLAGLREILGKYTKLLKQYGEDPQLSTLETATAQCLLLMATSYLDDLQFEDCLELCADVKEIMNCKAARYVACGKKPRPDSLVWCRLVAVLADAKWKGPVELRNRVLSLDEMVGIYEQAEANVRAGLARFPRATKSHSSLIASLACCGKQLIRALMRWQPSKAEAFAKRFAAHYGAVLEDPRHPFYWDIRICSLYLRGCQDRCEYSFCYANSRRAFLDMPFASEDLRAYDFASAKELEYLLRHAYASSAVIEFPSR